MGFRLRDLQEAVTEDPCIYAAVRLALDVALNGGDATGEMVELMQVADELKSVFAEREVAFAEREVALPASQRAAFTEGAAAVGGPSCLASGGGGS